jgi:hypothetical protein
MFPPDNEMYRIIISKDILKTLVARYDDSRSLSVTEQSHVSTQRTSRFGVIKQSSNEFFVTVLCSYRPNRRGISHEQCDKTWLIVTSKYVLDFGVTSFKNRHRRYLRYIMIFEQVHIQWGMLQRTILQRMNATTNNFYQQYQDTTTNTDATTNDPTSECYNKQFLSIKSGCYDEHRCYNERG